MKKKCKVCEIEFVVRKRKKNYCSKPCFVKGITIGFHISSSGYRMIWKPEHPQATKAGYILEHRLVMMEHLGRELEKDEVVHHINAKKLDNRIENLQVISRQDIGRAPKLNTECPQCHYRYIIA